jgi:hypothetical protein
MKTIFFVNSIFLGMIGPFQLFLMLGVTSFLALTIIAFIRLLESKEEPVNKILWALFILLFQLIGPVVFLIWHHQKIKNSRNLNP